MSVNSDLPCTNQDTQIPIWGSLPDGSEHAMRSFSFSWKKNTQHLYLQQSNESTSGSWDVEKLQSLCGCTARKLSLWKVRGYFKYSLTWLPLLVLTVRDKIKKKKPWVQLNHRVYDPHSGLAVVESERKRCEHLPGMCSKGLTISPATKAGQPCTQLHLLPGICLSHTVWEEMSATFYHISSTEQCNSSLGTHTVVWCSYSSSVTRKKLCITVL